MSRPAHDLVTCSYRSPIIGATHHNSDIVLLLILRPDAGYEVPVLARIAQKVTALVSSAGGCERNWSSYDSIHSKKRNRLQPARANDLVYVFTNARLIQRFRAPEKFAEWVAEIASDDENEDGIDYQDEENES